MAGLVRFSEAISSSVSDWRRYSLRMRFAMSGSALSSARKDMVTIGAATPESYPRSSEGIRTLLCKKDASRAPESHVLYKTALSGSRRWWPQQLRGGDGALAQDVRLGAGQVKHRGRDAARRAPSVEHSGEPRKLPRLLAGHSPVPSLNCSARRHPLG